MVSRLTLHEILVDILGSNNVYFQPSESISINYPAIVYSISDIYNSSADDTKYRMLKDYTITHVHRKVDDETVMEKLLKLEYCDFDRRYISDNLIHDVYRLYC